MFIPALWERGHGEKRKTDPCVILAIDPMTGLATIVLETETPGAGQAGRLVSSIPEAALTVVFATVGTDVQSALAIARIQWKIEGGKDAQGS